MSNQEDTNNTAKRAIAKGVGGRIGWGPRGQRGNAAASGTGTGAARTRKPGKSGSQLITVAVVVLLLVGTLFLMLRYAP